MTFGCQAEYARLRVEVDPLLFIFIVAALYYIKKLIIKYNNG